MKIKKIAIINPPTKEKITKEGRVIMPLSITFEPPRMPLSMALIAGGLIEESLEVEIIDAIGEMIDLEEVEQRIIKFKPDLTIVNCSTPTLEDDLGAVSRAKKHNSLCALFGQHVDALPEETMFKHKEVDYIFLKDPELIAKSFVVGFNNQIGFEQIHGLVYRNGESITKNNCKSSNHLDDFPLPARHLLKNDLYKLPDGDKYSVILASRGCPFECPFCEASEYHGKDVRRRTPTSLVNEVEFVIKEFNIKSFLFQSDLFTSNREWVISVCDEIIRRNIHIRWIANTRIDTVDYELLKKMKSAGCFLLGIGVESGSPKMLPLLGKKVSPEQIKTALSHCREIGIKTSCSFVVGFPGETRESLKETEQLVIDANPDFAVFMTAYPFPGTKLYKMLSEENSTYQFRDEWEKNCFTGNSIKGVEVEKELQAFCKKMLRKHFFSFKFLYNQRWLLKKPVQLLLVLFYTIKKLPLMYSSFRKKSF